MKSRFVCQGCGHATARWLGRCPACDGWDTFVEEAVRVKPGGKGRAAAAATEVTPLATVDDEGVLRFASGLPLLDRVLGGGVVAGSAVLLAGEPGIGKSTLLLAVAEAVAAGGRRTLYVSAEESPRQLRLRAQRLGCGHPELLVAGETQVESVLAAVEEHAPAALFVDSIQAVRSGDLDSLPGSVGQVRACAEVLVEQAKRRHCSLFLVGHVTKEGSIAGPKSLEHLVDTVLTFEGEGTAGHRLLRAAKNRFGPTGEVALYEMRDDGLVGVSDPSRVLLARRRPEAPGSAVAATLHGSRPVLVEVQALVHASGVPSPRRTSLGLDGNRVALLVAVLERFGGASFADRDLYLNVVGGLSVREPAVDLAVAAALLSALSERPVPREAAFFGEIGLLGELRPVGQAEARLREIATLGFRIAYVPRLEGLPAPPGLRRVELEHVGELAAALGGA
ncbi:MAG TPA: DNA repair protein RadA [Thermoanaerobaculia bacterium]|nr:DNA repair protein RadA [Thermoanaerobaculia bacterium]